VVYHAAGGSGGGGFRAGKAVRRMFVGIAHSPEMEPGPVGFRRIFAKRFPTARHVFCRAKKGRGFKA
jgi:hypothetical protein